MNGVIQSILLCSILQALPLYSTDADAGNEWSALSARLPARWCIHTRNRTSTGVDEESLSQTRKPRPALVAFLISRREQNGKCLLVCFFWKKSVISSL